MQSVNCLGSSKTIKPELDSLRAYAEALLRVDRAANESRDFFVVLSSQNSILSLIYFFVFLLLGVGISLPLVSFANTLSSGSCSDLRGGIQNLQI